MLGWKLRKNTSRISRKFVNGELVYRAEISVDSNGLRVTPPCAVGCDGAVLFFGDSFTYGEGVDDSLTLPYQFSVRTRNRFRVYNFGVHGYGPQHMLAQVEGGMVDSLVNEEVKHIIYQVIYPEHIYRLMGYWSWDVNGPGYVLGKDNEVIRSGNFKRNIRRYRFQTGIMGRSAFFRRVFTYQRPLKPAEKELFVAVIKKTKTLLDAKYPGSDFHMIVWDWTNGSDSLVFNQLKDAGIKIHEKADIFPGGKVGMDCRIGPMDMHPNGRAYGIMAGYLCRILLLTDD